MAAECDNHSAARAGLFFYVSLGHFVFVLLASVEFNLVSSILSQEIGWEERL